MKVIPETWAVSSNSTMGVPDEGYSRNMSGIFKLYYERTWGRLFQKRAVSSNSTMSVPDEGYSRHMSGIFKLYYERTWWRLFQKHERYLQTLLWAYLMKVIPETWAVSSNSTMSVPDEGYSTNMSGIFKLYYERTWWRLFQKHERYLQTLLIL
jgi:hypothetical protein